MDISIITVNTNDKELILDQIDSAFKAGGDLEMEEIISDNGSTDGSLEEIRKRFVHVQIVENKKNVGFGTANNNALPLTSGEFILFLNPDMRLEPGSLQKLVQYMREHPDVGILSCKLVDEHGNFNQDAKPRRFPKLFDQICIVLKISRVFGSLLRKYAYHDFDPDREQEVDSVRGSFMLTRRSIIDRLGWAFDPRYFIWFEDVDTCREVKRMGYKIMYVPTVSCVDYVGQTFKRQPSTRKQVWFTGSMLKYFKKWEPWYVWIWIALVRPIGIVLVALHSFLVQASNRIHSKN